MLSKSINELKEKLELRNKILSCCQIVGPIGPRGPRGERGIQGEPGLLIASSNEGIFFTGFADTNVTGEMIIQDPWLIPNPSEYISIISESEIEIEPGIYEITLTGLIENADEDHGAAFYLKNEAGSAIKDLSFQLPIGEGKIMHFSQVTLFKFDTLTTLQVMVNILGEEDTSNVTISDVNLLIKKIHT